MDEDDESFIIPLNIPRKRSTHELVLDPDCEPNKDRPEQQGFVLSLTFDGGPFQGKAMKLCPENMEEEAKRCMEQLDSTRLILAGLDAEAGQMEAANDQLRRAIDEEERRLRDMDLEVLGYEEELAECCNLANRATEELASKTAAAKSARTKRFETECALRELQLTICRRKLEFATAQSIDDDCELPDFIADDDIDLSVDHLLGEEEQRIDELLKELEESNQSNNRALADMEQAEVLDGARQKARQEVEQRITRCREECQARRQQLANQRQLLERNLAKLDTLNRSRRKEKLKEVELMQQQAVLDAARQLEELDRLARELVDGARLNNIQ